MYDSMLVDGLPVNKVATLIRDGPNVNKTIFRKVNERIITRPSKLPRLQALTYRMQCKFAMILLQIRIALG